MRFFNFQNSNLLKNFQSLEQIGARKMNPNYYIVIPAEIHANNNLKLGERLIYGTLLSFSQKWGYSNATNTQLAKIYDVTKTTISTWIMDLKEAGVINIEYVYKNNKVIERRIYPLVTVPKKDAKPATNSQVQKSKSNTPNFNAQKNTVKKSQTTEKVNQSCVNPTQKNLKGYTKKFVGGIQKNLKDINTRDININNNKYMSSDSALDQKSKSNNSITNKPVPVHDDNIPYKEIIAYLNRRTNRSFQAETKETRALIRDRFAEGYRFRDFKNVIDTKIRDWQYSPKWAVYLRPSTLFSEKFKKYNAVAQKRKTKKIMPKKRIKGTDWKQKQAEAGNKVAPVMSDAEMNAIFKQFASQSL